MKYAPISTTTPSSCVVYQAYNPNIAKLAVRAQRFVEPFSMTRMTWIKPSFLWMMERCGWAQKTGQERVLAVRITRTGWDEALSRAVLSSFKQAVHGTMGAWREQQKVSPVTVQWDPERNLSGGKLDYESIQVGLSRKIVPSYVNEWILGIEDITPLVKRIHALRESGDTEAATEAATELLPPSRPYPAAPKLAVNIGLSVE